MLLLQGLKIIILASCAHSVVLQLVKYSLGNGATSVRVANTAGRGWQRGCAASRAPSSSLPGALMSGFHGQPTRLEHMPTLTEPRGQIG